MEHSKTHVEEVPLIELEPAPDPVVIQRPKKHFTYLNGDQYFGEYGIDINTMQIYRHGCGSYVTSKGSIYQGKWTFDRLLDFATIKYWNKHIFCGFLDSLGNYQKGTYDFDDCCRVCGTFQDSPRLEFHDLNDTFWKATLSKDYLSVTNKDVV